MTKQQKLILFVLTSINFTHILDFMIMMPLSNYLMPAFKISPEEFSHIVAAYSISAGISAFIGMFFVDKFDRKKVVLFAYSGFLIGTFCCGIAPNYFFILLARIVAGIFGGILGAQVISIVADSFSYEVRGRAMGVLFGAFSLASVIGVPLSLTFADKFGWHAPFYFIVIVGLFVLVGIIKILPSFNNHIASAKEHKVNVWQTFKTIVLKKENLIAYGLSATLMMGHFVIIPFLNPYMQHNVGFTENERKLVYIVGGLVSIFSARFAGKLADKYGKHTIFYACAALSLIPIYIVSHLGVMPYYYALIITGIWFIFSTSRNIPAQAIISNIVPPHQRGSFQSFNSCITSVFIGLASLVSGKIVVQDAVSQKILHYDTLGLVSIAVIIVSIIIATQIPKQAVATNKS